VSSSAAATASTLMPLARSLFFKKGGNSCGIPSLLSQGADRRRRWPECSSTNIAQKAEVVFPRESLEKRKTSLTASSPPYAHTRAARVALCTEYRRALKSFYHTCRDAAWCFVISSSPSSCGR
jgi:hypothetical protein